MARRDEVRLLPPRLLPLCLGRRQAAVRLLSELVLDAAQRGCPAAEDASAEVDALVVPLPAPRSNKRKVA